MPRIADAVVALLSAGPAAPEDLGRALRRDGVTRARDPGAAVRRAARADGRIVELADGRLASIAQALAGVELTAVVTPEAAAVGRLDVDPDLAPLAALGLGPAVALPRGMRAGDLVAVRVEDPARRSISLRPLKEVAARPGDEAALLAAVGERLGRWDPERPWIAPPITHLGTVALSVAACAPGAFRGPGRPLSEVLARGGYEVHLGWVGAAGTEWASLTEEEADALEADVADLLAAERGAEALLVQERLLTVLRRHLPARVPAARRRLARLLARVGRPRDALAELVSAFPGDDPEDRYQAALIAYRTGDEVSARRWVEEGLARALDPASEEVAACLADLAHDIDAQATFLRHQAGLDRVGPDPEGLGLVARAVADQRRSYLVESMADHLAAALGPGALADLLPDLGAAGPDGREACIAFAAVLSGPLARLARESAGQDARPALPAVAGLVTARPVAAWATSRDDAPDQQQLVVGIAKERGRISPLVALIDLSELGGAVKDAFFLPDMAEPRLRRELLDPMGEVGLRPHPIDLDDALGVLRRGLARTAAIGWRIPSLDQQPVLQRIDRWVLRARPDAGRRPSSGSAA